MRLVAALCAAALAAGCCELSGPRWHGRLSNHFDGARFHNQVPGDAPGAAAVMQWGIDRLPGRWPAFVDAPAAPPPPRRVAGLRVTMVNHSTVLIQIANVNVLTDPIWGDVAGPTRFLGRKRRRPPGIRIEDLPPIDVVLISHDHYDHLDTQTLSRIATAHHPHIVAGLGMAALLESYGIGGVTDLDWWQWISPARGLQVWAVPARHGCRRGPCDHNKRLWAGFVLRTREGDVYFAGDTGYGPHFQQIEGRFGAPRLALLPIAPGKPRALFGPVHLDAHDAVIAARVLGAEENVPIHFGTFAQGDEADGDAERSLRQELAAPDAPRFEILHNGEAWESSARAAVTSSRAAGGS